VTTRHVYLFTDNSPPLVVTIRIDYYKYLFHSDSCSGGFRFYLRGGAQRIQGGAENFKKPEGGSKFTNLVY